MNIDQAQNPAMEVCCDHRVVNTDALIHRAHELVLIRVRAFVELSAQSIQMNRILAVFLLAVFFQLGVFFQLAALQTSVMVEQILNRESALKTNRSFAVESRVVNADVSSLVVRSRSRSAVHHCIGGLGMICFSSMPV